MVLFWIGKGKLCPGSSSSWIPRTWSNSLNLDIHILTGMDFDLLTGVPPHCVFNIHVAIAILNVVRNPPPSIVASSCLTGLPHRKRPHITSDIGPFSSVLSTLTGSSSLGFQEWDIPSPPYELGQAASIAGTSILPHKQSENCLSLSKHGLPQQGSCQSD